MRGLSTTEDHVTLPKQTEIDQCERVRVNWKTCPFFRAFPSRCYGLRTFRINNHATALLARDIPAHIDMIVLNPNTNASLMV